VAYGAVEEGPSVPRRSPSRVELTEYERGVLEGRARKYTSPYRDVIRAKIVLLAAERLANDAIAARLDIPRQIVSKWRKRFCLLRLPGLEDQPRGGWPPRFPPRRGRRRPLQACWPSITSGTRSRGCPWRRASSTRRS